VEYFLTTLSKFYNIYLFTASAPAYATAIVDHLDP
jgi:TFIIF-interacting CTD phosphatase-like protein